MPELSFAKLPEDEATQYGRSPPGRGVPAPRAVLPPGAELPRNPPFKVYVRNLPNGVTVEEIRTFFGNLQVRRTAACPWKPLQVAAPSDVPADVSVGEGFSIPWWRASVTCSATKSWEMSDCGCAISKVRSCAVHVQLCGMSMSMRLNGYRGRICARDLHTHAARRVALFAAGPGP